MALNELVLADSERLNQMEEVSKLSIQGFNETQIAKETGLQRKVVVELLREYREILRDDEASRERARDALNAMDQHYNILIKKTWDTINEIEEQIQERPSHQLIAQKLSAVKTLSDLEAKRVDALQKAGILDANDLGEELAELERQRDIIVNILRKDLCQDCKKKTARSLADVTGQAEVVVVYDNES